MTYIVYFTLQTRSRVQSNARYTVSKLNFVDLAGSERLSKTRVSNSSTVVPTKSDSDVILSLQLLSKTLTCTLHLS